ANVSFTLSLYVSPVQTIPSLDHVGTPDGFDGLRHFRCSVIAGSALTISARMRSSVSSRQSRSSIFGLSARDAPLDLLFTGVSSGAAKLARRSPSVNRRGRSAAAGAMRLIEGSRRRRRAFSSDLRPHQKRGSS